MNIYQCQRMAQEIGFDSTTFKADFPAGTFDCMWLDAYMGLVRVDADGVRDGFMTVEQLDSMFPDLNCHSLSAARDHPADQQPPTEAQAQGGEELTMPRYNHAYTLAFSVESKDPEGEDVSPQMLRTALLRRIDDLDIGDEWIEATGAPFDTYEVDKLISVHNGKHPNSGPVYTAPPSAPVEVDANELTGVRARLKSGDYDGADVMRAWLAIDKLLALTQQPAPVAPVVDEVVASLRNAALLYEDGSCARSSLTTAALLVEHIAAQQPGGSDND